MHVIVGQSLVPGISFHAEFEIALPDFGGNAISDLTRRHVIVKLLAASERMLQRIEEFAWSLHDFGNWINKSLVIARLMPFHRRRNRSDDIFGVAVFREEHLNACAGGLRGLDEDEFVFVRKDHFPEGTSRTLRKCSPPLA